MEYEMLFFQYVFGHILAVEKEEDRQLNVGIGMQPAQDGHCGQSSKWLPSLRNAEESVGNSG